MKTRYLRMIAAVLTLCLIVSFAAGCKKGTDNNAGSESKPAETKTADSETESDPNTVKKDIDPSSPVGAWILRNGDAYSIFNLYEDGTLLFNASEIANRSFGSWKADGERITITLYAADEVYIFSGDKLTKEDDGSVVYERYTEENEK